jgi:hypothetical protein
MKWTEIRPVAIALTVAVGLLSVGAAQDRPPAEKPAPSAPSDLGFLEIGRTYFIRFPEGQHPLQVKESGITAQPSGPPGTWRINYQIDQFTVRKLGGGSWALLEHPVDPKSATEILAARNLMEDKPLVAEMEADPKRREFLAGRRKAARDELKMTQTWINLAHAITISDSPPPGWKQELKVNVEIK